MTEAADVEEMLVDRLVMSLPIHVKVAGRSWCTEVYLLRYRKRYRHSRAHGKRTLTLAVRVLYRSVSLSLCRLFSADSKNFKSKQRT